MGAMALRTLVPILAVPPLPGVIASAAEGVGMGTSWGFRRWWLLMAKNSRKPSNSFSVDVGVSSQAEYRRRACLIALK